jgi:hypothetical protein
MITKQFNMLGTVEIDGNNCTDIFTEALQIMQLAIEVQTVIECERARSFHRSQSVKRGIQWKKQNGHKRSEEFGAAK